MGVRDGVDGVVALGKSGEGDGDGGDGDDGVGDEEGKSAVAEVVAEEKSAVVEVEGEDDAGAESPSSGVTSLDRSCVSLEDF